MTGPCNHCGRWIERYAYVYRGEIYCDADCQHRKQAVERELPRAEEWVVAAGLILRDGERMPRALRGGA